jgi:hypothetical protein
MRKVIVVLCLACLLVVQAGCSFKWPFGSFAKKPPTGGNGSRADQKRPANWESAVMAEWDKERPDDKEWHNLRSLNQQR